MRACCVDHRKTPLLNVIDNLGHHSMRADNHPIRIDAVDRVGDADSTLLELGNNTGVMDERPKRTYRTACFRCFEGHVERTLHAIASARIGSLHNFEFTHGRYSLSE